MLKLQHTGFIVSDIDKWESNMMFEQKIADVFDSHQQARISLYKNFSSAFIELIQPLNKDSYTWNALEKNGSHFHHFCYEVENTVVLKKIIDKYKMIEVLKPIPAVLFQNKFVTFYFNRNKQIVEFLINCYEN